MNLFMPLIFWCIGLTFRPVAVSLVLRLGPLQLLSVPALGAHSSTQCESVASRA